MINCIIKPTSCTFLNFILITSTTCFEEASCSSSGGIFTVHAVYGMYHAEHVLKLFKLYIVYVSCFCLHDLSFAALHLYSFSLMFLCVSFACWAFNLNNFNTFSA